jgi:DNA uptake protein ComE-like DNA-binding protein
MRRIQTCAALVTAGLLSLAVVRAEEPIATPKPASDSKPAVAKPAADVKPAIADKTPAAKEPSKDAKADAKAGDAKGKQAAGKPARKSLIAPPGLLSQPAPLQTWSAPGLGKLNLNTATIEQIQRLPGVGLVWAPRILAGRPYSSFGDLARAGVPFDTIDALSRSVELGR